MSINTYMDLFGNQEISIIFVEIKTNKIWKLYKNQKTREYTTHWL